MGVGLLSVAGAGLLVAVVAAPADPQETAGETERLQQELTVSQKSRYRIQGVESQADLEYGVLSRLAVRHRADGGLFVEQKVQAASLIQADALTKAVLSDLLKKLQGARWEMDFNAQGEVIRFQGGNDRVQAAAAHDQPGALTFLLASLVDQDGWKELGQWSFFRPPTPLRAGAKWQRPMTHRWGTLGQWTGRVGFTYAGSQGGLQRFPFAFKLTYAPPKAPDRGLPFAISNPSFKHLEAGGTIWFDAKKQRVSHVEERFHVQGELWLSLLGQSIPVHLDEDQRFRLRLLDDAAGSEAMEEEER